MSKEVRLNDKMWFGKYQGKSIKDIIHIDKGFLDNLVVTDKIKFNKNILEYIKVHKKYKPRWDDDDHFEYNESNWDYDDLQELIRSAYSQTSIETLSSNTTIGYRIPQQALIVTHLEIKYNKNERS